MTHYKLYLGLTPVEWLLAVGLVGVLLHAMGVY